MNLITNTWRQLVRRRLWPIALLLVAALVAVPLKLSKAPAETPAVPAATLAKAEQAEAVNKPVVELKTADATTSRRRVLGQSKDPFEPAPLPKKKKKKAKAAEATPTPAPTSAPSGGGTTAPPTSGPAAPAEPTVTLPKGSLKVRFGLADSTGDLPLHFVNRLEPLPNTDAPVLVFEGTRDNGRVAVFSIPGDVTAVGDGSCDPNPEDCETLKLRAGQTEFITLKGAGDAGADVQYQLDLVNIFEKATKVPKADVEAAATAAGASS